MNPLLALWTGLRVGFRRLLRGPRRPSWTWGYETFVALLRHEFAKPMAGREAQARRNLDQTGDRLLRPGLARFTPATVGGVAGQWAEPLQGPASGVVLYLHGGGYVVGSVASHRPALAELCHRAGARVLGIDYRLAPEHPCPAAIEDAVAVYQALLAQGEQPGRIALAGDSAGGGLTLATLVALRERGIPLPAGAVLFSPWTDLTLSGSTLRDDAGCDMLTETRVRELAGPRFYARDLGPNDPRVSPLFADLAGLPPLLVFAGASEILLDDSRRLADRARAAGVTVELHVEPDEVHVYPLFVGYSPAAERSLDAAATFLRERLRQ